MSGLDDEEDSCHNDVDNLKVSVSVAISTLSLGHCIATLFTACT